MTDIEPFAIFVNDGLRRPAHSHQRSSSHPVVIVGYALPATEELDPWPVSSTFPQEVNVMLPAERAIIERAHDEPVLPKLPNVELQ